MNALKNYYRTVIHALYVDMVICIKTHIFHLTLCTFAASFAFNTFILIFIRNIYLFLQLIFLKISKCVLIDSRLIHSFQTL